MEWISVKDRLPEKYCQVLVYCPRSFPKNCRFLAANYYDDNQKFYCDAHENVHDDVTHWMLITKPPKEECDHNFETINGGFHFKDMSKCKKCGHSYIL